jgi:hypothetical protein
MVNNYFVIRGSLGLVLSISKSRLGDLCAELLFKFRCMRVIQFLINFCILIGIVALNSFWLLKLRLRKLFYANENFNILTSSSLISPL